MPAWARSGTSRRIAERRGDADQQRAARDQRALLGQRQLDGEDDAGTGQGGGRVGRDLRAGGGEVGVGDGGGRAGAGFDGDGQPQADQTS